MLFIYIYFFFAIAIILKSLADMCVGWKTKSKKKPKKPKHCKSFIFILLKPQNHNYWYLHFWIYSLQQWRGQSLLIWKSNISLNARWKAHIQTVITCFSVVFESIRLFVVVFLEIQQRLKTKRPSYVAPERTPTTPKTCEKQSVEVFVSHMFSFRSYIARVVWKWRAKSALS